MRKLFYLFMVPALAATVLLTSCGKDDDEDPAPAQNTDACASATFPSTTGSSTVRILNYAATSNTSEVPTVMTTSSFVNEVSISLKSLNLDSKPQVSETMSDHKVCK